MAVLSEDVVFITDGGAGTRAPRRPIVGAESVSRLLLHEAPREEAASTVSRLVSVNGLPGFVAYRGLTPRAAVAFDIDGEQSHLPDRKSGKACTVVCRGALVRSKLIRRSRRNFAEPCHKSGGSRSSSMDMKLASIRLVTNDVRLLARFYSVITGFTPVGIEDYVTLNWKPLPELWQSAANELWISSMPAPPWPPPIVRLSLNLRLKTSIASDPAWIGSLTSS